MTFGQCRHVSGCTDEATEMIVIADDDVAGVCGRHAAEIQQGQEELSLFLGMLDRSCPRCGEQAPEGFLNHDCANPTPRHPEAD